MRIYEMVTGHETRDIAEIGDFEGRLIGAEWLDALHFTWIFETEEGEIGLWSCAAMNKVFFPLVDLAKEGGVFVRIKFIGTVDIGGGKSFKQLEISLDSQSAIALRAIQKEARETSELATTEKK